MELLTKELNKLFERSRFVYSVFSILIVNFGFENFPVENKNH